MGPSANPAGPAALSAITPERFGAARGAMPGVYFQNSPVLLPFSAKKTSSYSMMSAPAFTRFFLRVEPICGIVSHSAQRVEQGVVAPELGGVAALERPDGVVVVDRRSRRPCSSCSCPSWSTGTASRPGWSWTKLAR